MSFRNDNRALANNIMLFVGTLIIGFLLAIVLEPVATDLLEMSAAHTTSEAAAQGREYQYWTWQALPVIIIGFGVVQLLVAAVSEARVA